MNSKEQVWYSNPALEPDALTETRNITFPKDALVAAIKLLTSGSARPLPAGRIEACEIRGDPDIVVTINIRDETTGALNQIAFPAETVGAAMIAYCHHVNVPLPRTAEKSLALSGSNLMLCIHVTSHPIKPVHHTDNTLFAAKQ